MKKIINIITVAICLILGTSCNDYLNVVPDNIPTIDHAFNNRISAEKYLFTCYSYLPNHAHPGKNPGTFLAHESWLNRDADNNNYFPSKVGYHMARDGQTSNSPFFNFWDGGMEGTNLFIAIRDCNIFLENIDRPVDLEEYEKVRWIAEVKFLKAYYHFFLLRMYGPIPIIKENLPVSSTGEQIYVYREPVEEVVNYIVKLLDEAVTDLPDKINNEIEEMGRITKSIALALKAKVLVMNASPLFNGNPFYANYIDSRGKKLFSTEYDASKWNLAADALKEAISFAESQGSELYYYKGFDPITDITRTKLNIRKSITERWNTEIIWGSTQDDKQLQKNCHIRYFVNQKSNVYCTEISPTLQTIERFYTNHGVPITEDITWDYFNRYQIQKATSVDRYYIKEGYTTAKLNFNREPRYYASLYFDGSINYGNGVIGDKEYSTLPYSRMKKGEPGGKIASECYSGTGYSPKKLVAVETVGKDNTFSTKRYSFPIIRLADLYLMYAEVLNEIKTQPDAEVYKWIDRVRERAGLRGVVESWEKYSSNPNKCKTQKGMRSIIHQERLNELAFECQAYWDLLRWKEAEKELNQPIQGWSVNENEESLYYKIKTYDYPTFTIKDYFFPIKQSSLDVNPNLIQTYGWENEK